MRWRHDRAVAARRDPAERQCPAARAVCNAANASPQTVPYSVWALASRLKVSASYSRIGL